MRWPAPFTRKSDLPTLCIFDFRVFDLDPPWILLDKGIHEVIDKRGPTREREPLTNRLRPSHAMRRHTDKFRALAPCKSSPLLLPRPVLLLRGDLFVFYQPSLFCPPVPGGKRVPACRRRPACPCLPHAPPSSSPPPSQSSRAAIHARRKPCLYQLAAPAPSFFPPPLTLPPGAPALLVALLVWRGRGGGGSPFCLLADGAAHGCKQMPSHGIRHTHFSSPSFFTLLILSRKFPSSTRGSRRSGMGT